MQYYSDVVDYLIKSFFNFINVTLIVPTSFDVFLLNNSLNSKLKSSCFLPKIYELDRFIFEFSKIENLHMQGLVFLLHEVYQEICGKINIVEFYNFGIKLLGDFELLNKYQLDLERFKEVNILGGFCNFSNLKDIYSAFNLKLKDLNIGYRASHLNDFFLANFNLIEKEKSVLIIGFDEFLPIEKSWIDHLKSIYDVKIFPPSVYVKKKKESKVYCIKSPTIFGQILYVSSKLKQLIEGNKQMQCDITISGSEILLPLLQSLGDKGQEANLLIKYSFLGTKTYLSCKSFANFYKASKICTDFLSVSILLEIIKACPFWFDKFTRLKSFIDLHSFDCISIESIKELLDHSFYELIFPSVLQNFFDYIKIVFTNIYVLFDRVSDYIEVSSCLALLEVVDEYLEYVNFYSVDDLISIFNFRLDTLFFVLKRFNNSNISIIGFENLGALEYCDLSDRKILFFINANEDLNIPTFESFNYLHIGNITDKFSLLDKVRYLKIVRAIENSEEVFCLFNDSAGELNRHILRFCYTNEREIISLSLVSNFSKCCTKKIAIKKDKYVLEKLKAYDSSVQNHKSFSVTHINSYLDCSLKFYFRYLSNLKIISYKATDQQVFGTILHRVLSQIYGELSSKNKFFSVETFINTQDLAQKIIEDSFKDFFLQKTKNKLDLNGEQFVLMEIMRKMVSQFLYIDSSGAPFELFSLEERYDCKIPLNIEGNLIINFFGIFDRVDIQSGAYRIIDYKLGAFNEKIVNIEDLFSHFEKKRNPIALQLIVYSYIFFKKLDSHKFRVSPKVVSFKNLFTKNSMLGFSVNCSKGYEELIDISDYVDTIENCLIKIIDEIYSKEYVFFQTEDIEVCNSCIFISICQR